MMNHGQCCQDRDLTWGSCRASHPFLCWIAPRLRFGVCDRGEITIFDHKIVGKAVHPELWTCYGNRSSCLTRVQKICDSLPFTYSSCHIHPSLLEMHALFLFQNPSRSVSQNSSSLSLSSLSGLDAGAPQVGALLSAILMIFSPSGS